MPNIDNVLNRRFILASNGEETNKKVWKTRLFVPGHRSKRKTSLVHDTFVSKHKSTKLLIGLASMFEFRTFSTDVIQAYLQNAEELMTEAYVSPTKELELEPNQLLKPWKPLYVHTNI